MKRFLSIVLIAAAIFGIYNYYVNIMDVFACKTYWEEKSSDAEDTLNALGAALNKLKRNKKTYTSGQKQLTKGEKSLAASEGKYYQAGSQLSSTKSKIAEGEAAVNELTQMINAINKVRTTYKTWKTSFDKIKNERSTVVKSLKARPDFDDRTVRQMLNGYAMFLETEKQRSAYLDAVKGINNSNQRALGYKNFASDCNTVATTIDSIEIKDFVDHLESERKTIAALDPYDQDDLDKLEASLNDTTQDTYRVAIWILRMSLYYDEKDVKGEARSIVNKARKGNEEALIEIISCADDEYTEEVIVEIANGLKWMQYSITDPMKKCSADINTIPDKLASNQDDMAKGVQNIFKAILSDSTLKKYAKKALGDKAIEIIEVYAKDPSPLSTNEASFLSFETQMDSKPGLDKSLEKAQKYLTTQKTSANKSLSSAKTKYKNGLKSYNSTPKKLETARKKLDNIKKKLAQFESSEKELEKGLNTLANTEANGDLKSIKDRLGGKVKFTDKKGHIDINKGFDAVDAGEAYLNEQGDLIKKEITGRIIATVMGVISAVLALLAALLSLFRSNRGAAIIACISAVMAAGAAALGSGTSSVYSELAGSHVGNAPWMAAAIIAGVAMVFSVTHFAAKVEDPLTEEE